MSVVAELTSGGVAGAVGILATQPLDTIRIRLQRPPEGRPYAGILSCAASTVRNEGIRGLYKGVCSPVVTVGAMNAVLFLSYEHAGRRLSGGRGQELTMPQVCLAGMFAGAWSSLITSPTELVKCVAQVDLESEGRVSEEWAIFRRMLRDHGWLGAHGPCRGLLITMLRETPSFGLYFTVYESLCRKFGKSDIVTLSAGGLAGPAAWSSIYPVDVIKTRWQTASPGQYSSIGHCFRSSVAQEGPAVLFRGFGATMARSMPQSAITFYTYELVKGLLDGK